MHDARHDKGLAHDLETIANAMADRRQVLRWAVGAGLVALVGCGEDASGSGGAGGAGGSGCGSTSSTGGTATCATIPSETAGPYPGDGSNNNSKGLANALALAGIVRSDLVPSFAGSSGSAEGVPLTIELSLADADGGCAALAGYAVYLWHCDRDGKYSMYDLVDVNYLRGVQEAGADGTVTFTTVFPGCYNGRMPHVHFEIFASLAAATAGSAAVKTSQLALPLDACDAVYASAGYGASVAALANISFEKDNVFSDGVTLQLASATGSVAAGYVATLTVGV